MTLSDQDIARLETWIDMYAEILEDWNAALWAGSPAEPHWRKLLRSVDHAFEAEVNIIALENKRVSEVLIGLRERTV